MGKLHNGPFETEREAHAAAHQVVRPEPGWSILHKSQNRFVVEQACESAGVELGVYDRQIIDWLAGFEDSMCAVVAGLVARAVAAARPGAALRHVRPDKRPPRRDVLRADPSA